MLSYNIYVVIFGTFFSDPSCFCNNIKIKKMQRKDHKSEAKMGSIYFIENAGGGNGPFIGVLYVLPSYWEYIRLLWRGCSDFPHSFLAWID